MVARGYSTRYLVADALGTHDGVVPVQMVDTLIEAAENWIDRRTGRSWLQATITGEQHAHSRSDWIVQLNVYPIVSVQAIRARTLYVGALSTTLSASDYEILDAAHGQLLLASPWYLQRLSIDYTASAPLPAAINLAATLLVASWVRPMIGAGTGTSGAADPTSMIAQGIKSYSIGSDLSVTFQDNASRTSEALAAPPEVLRLVDQYRPMAIA